MQLKVDPRIPNGQYSHQFLQAMLDRVAVAYTKYGPTADRYGAAASEETRYTCLKFLDDCITAYLRTGNTEYLVDAANFCMIEFMYPTHRNAHFRETDADESAIEVESL